MSDKMVLLAIYGNPFEAELARADLEAEGIPARVMGATSGDLFAGMGVGLSNVQLLVPEKDYERATKLLAEESDVARENRERERERSTAIKEAEAAEADSTDVRPAIEKPVKPEPAPAAPPEAADEPPDQAPHAEADDDEREERPLTWTRDDLAVRAFRAALFGYLTLGFLHAYALWMLSAIPFTEGRLSPVGARKAWAALALALLPWLVALVIIWNAIN